MNRHIRHVPRTLRGLTFASAVSLAVLGIAGAPSGTEASARPLIGDFTGAVLPAGPVYQLPRVHVAADWSVELARVKREDRAAHNQGILAGMSDRELAGIGIERRNVTAVASGAWQRDK